VIKHAFPSGRNGLIRVGLEALDDRLHLAIDDNGVGFDISQRGAEGSQGQELVKGLSNELRGELTSRQAAARHSTCRFLT